MTHGQISTEEVTNIKNLILPEVGVVPDRCSLQAFPNTTGALLHVSVYEWMPHTLKTFHATGEAKEDNIISMSVNGRKKPKADLGTFPENTAFFDRILKRPGPDEDFPVMEGTWYRSLDNLNISGEKSVIQDAQTKHNLIENDKDNSAWSIVKSEYNKGGHLKKNLWANDDLVRLSEILFILDKEINHEEINHEEKTKLNVLVGSCFSGFPYSSDSETPKIIEAVSLDETLKRRLLETYCLSTSVTFQVVSEETIRRGYEEVYKDLPDDKEAYELCGAISSMVAAEIEAILAIIARDNTNLDEDGQLNHLKKIMYYLLYGVEDNIGRHFKDKNNSKENLFLLQIQETDKEICKTFLRSLESMKESDDGRGHGGGYRIERKTPFELLDPTRPHCGGFMSRRTISGDASRRKAVSEARLARAEKQQTYLQNYISTLGGSTSHRGTMAGMISALAALTLAAALSQ